MEELAPDPALVAAVLEGETGRFEELVRRHEPRVRRIVERSVRDADTRDELVQATFFAAFRRLAQLASAERLGAWLARIARSSVADHRQRADREVGLQEEAWTQRAGAAPRDPWIWEEVARLQPIHAEALRLRYLESLSYAEIAARLGVPHSTVRGRIHEARRALRARLGDDQRGAR